VAGEALGPAKTEPIVNVIVGGRAVMGENGEGNNHIEGERKGLVGYWPRQKERE